ncbi:MAG: NAD(P)H-dependent oxidoreductase subunit E, partial [Finegoldia magna]|nr:NAD(P)H-dependent oxidoreductase subunit E [Finegoldia magna]
DIIPASIYGVITFYSRFTLKPKGKYAISVCMGTACYVKGAENLLDEFSKRLGIEVGDTTDDLIFSLVETRCVGDCASAPVVTVNDTVYKNVKLEDVAEILSNVKES